MFGRALYCPQNRWENARPPLDEISADPAAVIASIDKRMGGHVRRICNDTDIISLAERAHQAFPECAVLGVDIIRDRQTGRLNVLEVNPHGAVWLLSSPLALTFDPDQIRARYAQFNLLDHAADVPIHKAREAAC